MLSDLENKQSISEIGFLNQSLNLVVQAEMTAEQPKHILFKNSNRSLFQTAAQQISS